MADKYFVWDYERLLVTEYQRTGQCNQCGQCCMAAASIAWKDCKSLRIHPEKAGDGYRSTDRQGVWCEVNVNDQRRFYPLHTLGYPCDANRCKALTSSNQCSRQLEKKRFSTDWPFHPAQVDIPYSQCSYRFISIGQWKISDNG